MSIIRSKTWISIPENTSISQLMNQNAFNTPADKIIYEEAFSGATRTYGQFREEVRRGAYWLKHTLGLQPGQIVSVTGPSCIEYILAVHAVWWAGGTVSLINYSLHETEIAHAIDLVKPDFLVAHDTMLGKIPAILKRCETQHNLSILGMGLTQGPYPFISQCVAAETGGLEPYDLDGSSARNVPCAILLSSGTTGRAKAVMLSHYNLIATIMQLRADRPENWRPSQREVFFTPLSHIYALYVCFTSVFWLGSYVCLMPRFKIEPYCRLMQDRKATLARLVPVVAKILAESPIIQKYKYPALEYFSTSAAPLKAETAERLRKAFPGVALCQTYGCTELSGATTQSGTRDRDLPIVAAGTLVANCEMKFVDPEDDNKSNAQGPGEIVIRGPNIMMGYKDNPKATFDSMLPGGWYRTGDLGLINDNGYLIVYDRLKDIVKYNGFQVSPLELEEILIRHPAVDEAAVCGVWAESETTEVVRAYVVLRREIRESNREALAKELSKYVADQVAHYKRLHGGVVFVDSLPKNPTGKVLRRVLRDEAAKSKGENVRAKL